MAIKANNVIVGGMQHIFTAPRQNSTRRLFVIEKKKVSIDETISNNEKENTIGRKSNQMLTLNDE
jgi:hypothetical protein